MTPVFRYTVCWRDNYCRLYEWKHKDFATRKTAQLFAKAKKKQSNQPKPYILQSIVDKSFFQQSMAVEYVENRKIVYRNYEKKIRY